MIGALCAAGAMALGAYFALEQLEALGRRLLGKPDVSTERTLDPTLVNPRSRSEPADAVDARASAALGSDPHEALAWLGVDGHGVVGGTELARAIAERAYAAGAPRVYAAGIEGGARARCLLLELTTDPMQRLAARKLQAVAATLNMGSLVAVSGEALDGMLESVSAAQLPTPDVGQRYLAVCLGGP